jgi:hypothetical protein
MQLFSIHLFNRAESHPKDDVIRFCRCPGMPSEMYEVFYRPSKFRTTYRFWLSRYNAENYIANLIESLRHDLEPADSFQITPVIGPSVLYHTSDMEKSEVRTVIMDTVRMILNTDVHTDEV